MLNVPSITILFFLCSLKLVQMASAELLVRPGDRFKSSIHMYPSIGGGGSDKEKFQMGK